MLRKLIGMWQQLLITLPAVATTPVKEMPESEAQAGLGRVQAAERVLTIFSKWT